MLDSSQHARERFIEAKIDPHNSIPSKKGGISGYHSLIGFTVQGSLRSNVNEQGPGCVFGNIDLNLEYSTFPNIGTVVFD